MNPLLPIRRAMFSAVHGNALIYNQCWEDPRLDRAAMKLAPDDNVLVITSAGCNALDYLLDAPNHVYAVDLNPRQNALLDLKLAGIRSLDHATFFDIFGRGRHEHMSDIYWTKLRPKLCTVSREFWDKRYLMFAGKSRRRSFYFHGTTGYFAWLMNVYIDRFTEARDHIGRAFDSESIDEQRAIYEKHVQPEFWGKSVRWVVRRDATMAMLGVPRPQREQIDRDYRGGLSQFVEDCVAYVFSALPLRDNYFWRVYLTGAYSLECCPEYLKPQNFERLRWLVDKVSFHTDSVAGFLERNPTSISRFVLLDHMDWLCSYAIDQLRREWQAIVRRAANGAMLLWRSAGLQFDFINQLDIAVGKARRTVGSLLNYDHTLAAALHAKDRVHTYGSFAIAQFQPA